MKAPPPPSEPAPPNQPTIHMGFRLPNIVQNNNFSNKFNGCQQRAQNGNVPKYRTNAELYQNVPCDEPAPKPLPNVRKPPALPKVKALYDYSPRDLDELELKEDDIIEVLNERKFTAIFIVFNHN